MTNQEPAMMFDKDRAPSYDRMWAKLAPTRDAIHLLIRAILADLPVDARILCVGVGTGAELLDLAQAFPQWQFTAVEPAIPMLDICRQKAEACGITARCTFHEGYVDSLLTSDSFDAATSLLVSHFIMEPEDRIEFFHQIALRLRPQGYLISSDIAYDQSSSSYPGILEIWLQMMKLAGLPQEQIDKMRHVYGRDVAVLPLPAVASIIAAGGFESPVLFFQSLLIHGWYARRNTILQSHG
jgi:tRNA (cmo5U34)-methyltransferase